MSIQRTGLGAPMQSNITISVQLDSIERTIGLCWNVLVSHENRLDPDEAGGILIVV